jgi:DNA-binding HxlR family transcriptional regulator
MTKRENFEAIKNVLVQYGTQEQVACIEHEIELLNRKSTTPKKPTATQVENENYKTVIINYLTEVDTPKTIKEMQTEVPEVAGLTNQRITHILTALVAKEVIEKEYVKKVPYYSIKK